jgi:kynureninase
MEVTDMVEIINVQHIDYISGNAYYMCSISLFYPRLVALHGWACCSLAPAMDLAQAADWLVTVSHKRTCLDE